MEVRQVGGEVRADAKEVGKVAALRELVKEKHDTAHCGITHT